MNGVFPVSLPLFYIRVMFSKLNSAPLLLGPVAVRVMKVQSNRVLCYSAVLKRHLDSVDPELQAKFHAVFPAETMTLLSIHFVQQC